MNSRRLCIALTLLLSATFAFAAAPVCDVTCAPDPGGSGYDTTVTALTKPQNMRGTKTVFAPETAGSRVAYHATGNGQNAAQSKIVAGSSSYSYSIPILSLPGRNGLDLNLTLYYNSAIWNANSDGGAMTFNADRDFPSYGFRLGYGFIESNSAHTSFTLVEGDGTKRALVGGNSTYGSTDSSFIQFASTTNVLTYKNGTRVFYQQFPNNQTTLYRPIQIEDTNGNLISISYRTDTWVQGLEIATITDTVGRQIVFSYDPTTHELSAVSQGAQQYATFTWNNNYTLTYNFSGWLVQNSPANNSTQKVLTGVTYPGNGAGYSFAYGGWGIVNTIQFGPSGGSVVRNSVGYNYPPVRPHKAEVHGSASKPCSTGLTHTAGSIPWLWEVRSPILTVQQQRRTWISLPAFPNRSLSPAAVLPCAPLRTPGTQEPTPRSRAPQQLSVTPASNLRRRSLTTRTRTSPRSRNTTSALSTSGAPTPIT